MKHRTRTTAVWGCFFILLAGTLRPVIAQSAPASDTKPAAAPAPAAGKLTEAEKADRQAPDIGLSVVAGTRHGPQQA